jgi:2'-5' RNA ligase
MKKRIFVALPISKTLQGEILRWEENWRQLPARWLAGKNLHITLVPPWEESDVESMENVKKLLEVVSRKMPPFEISFGKVTYGPNPLLPAGRQVSPRLIWAEGQAVKEIITLKNELKRRLGQKKQKPERRHFLLHLTLARFRPENFPAFPLKKLDESVSWRDDIRSFVLMESHLSQKDADYEVLAEFRLAG